MFWICCSHSEFSINLDERSRSFFIPTKTVFIYLWKLCSGTSLAELGTHALINFLKAVLVFSGERVAGGSLEDDSVVAEKDGAFGWEQRRTSQQTGTATDGTALFSSVGEKVHAQP
jgi:hypothetical protein